MSCCIELPFHGAVNCLLGDGGPVETQDADDGSSFRPHLGLHRDPHHSFHTGAVYPRCTSPASGPRTFLGRPHGDAKRKRKRVKPHLAKPSSQHDRRFRSAGDQMESSVPGPQGVCFCPNDSFVRCCQGMGRGSPFGSRTGAGEAGCRHTSALFAIRAQ